MTDPAGRFNRSLRPAAVLGATCLAALLAAAPAEQPATTQAPVKRVSIAEFVKDPQKLASLRRGVKKMRDLKSTDPRSWVFQANIHWRPLFPVYVYEQANASADPAQQLFRDDPGFTPDPNVFNQCPHGNWLFLPWHRAYLHYFERILRWAADDPDLTLPYWNYSDPGQRELPPAFREAKVDGQPNPLYLPESATFKDNAGQPQVFLMRDAPLLRGQTQLTASATSLDALAIASFTSAKPLPANLGFGSPQACDASCSCGFGALESVPHNRIHTAVGGSSAQAGGSVRIGFMGDTSTAARDPIFWAHHANVDRLWASWFSLKQGREHPDDPEWLQSAFTFYDVVDRKGMVKPVTITVRELLTTEQLGYVYDKLEPLPDAVVTRPAPPLPGGGFEPLAKVPPRRPGPGKPDTPPRIQLTTTRRTEVPLSLAEGLKPPKLRDVLAPAPGGRAPAVILSLEGIEFEQPPGVDYEVYLNLPKQAAPNASGPYYVGALTFFGLKHRQGMQGHGAPRAPLYVKLTLPEKLRQALAAGKVGVEELQVTFVPQTGTEPVAGVAPAPGPAERPAVTIREIRLLRER
jgi:tyrosinase